VHASPVQCIRGLPDPGMALQMSTFSMPTTSSKDSSNHLTSFCGRAESNSSKLQTPVSRLPTAPWDSFRKSEVNDLAYVSAIGPVLGPRKGV
jgi:hypothetical protein